MKTFFPNIISKTQASKLYTLFHNDLIMNVKHNLVYGTLKETVAISIWGSYTTLLVSYM